MHTFNMKTFTLILAVAMAADCYNIDVKQFDGAFHFVKNNPSNQLDWWQTAVFYQIYPRSFMDSNGDGIGDLQGIIQKLDHLKDMGITAAWLSPIFKSPQVDQGYDISDYRDIQPEYGSLADFDELLEKAHALGIKIILDFVPNHTSDQHEWFTKSVNGEEKYKDFYVWKDCVKNKVVTPPNNWISIFKGSAWEYNEKRQQCYLHQFAIQQPDLNYRNPDVVQAMKDVLTYWLDKGVDGFRCDAVTVLFEDKEFRDEPLSNDPDATPNENAYLDHIYTIDQTETYDMIYQWRKHLDDYAKSKNTETKVMMTESYTTEEKTALYYGDGTRKGAHFTFNFNFITKLKKNFTVEDLRGSIEKWLVYLPNEYTSNWVLGNHDNHRVATRFGSEYIDAFNMIVAILPGVMVTYNGEEIGMEDGEVTCAQGHDPQAINDCDTFDKYSRDFERTPFQWDDSKNAGFSNGSTTWLPVSEKYKQVNLAAENVDGVDSHYSVYKKLVEIRKEFNRNASYDDVTIVKLSDKVLQIVRQTSYVEYDLILNIGDKDESVQFIHMEGGYEVVAASVGGTYKPKDYIRMSDVLNLKPYESVILYNSLSFASKSHMIQIPSILLGSLILVSIFRLFV